MALASGWSTKAPLTIDSSLVTATVTDLQIIITYDNLPSGITGASGCKEDGSDIRFTADIDGITEYPREIIKVDKATNIVTCYVRIPSISSTVDTTFYVWYNNPNAEEPSETSDSGSKTCWDNWYGVYHFGDMEAGWKGINDSSGKWSNFTANGTIVANDGHVTGLSSYEMSPTFGIELPEFITFAGNTNDYMFWCNFNGTHSVGIIANGLNAVPMGWLSAGTFGLDWGQAQTTAGAVPASGWHLVYMRNTGGTCRCYVDGVDRTNTTATAQAIDFSSFGKLTTVTVDKSEFRMTRDVNMSEEFYQVMYACESDPASFVSAGTPIVVSASIEIKITVVDQSLTPIEDAYVYVDEDFVDPQIMNKLTDIDGVASTNYDGSAVPATLRVRKYGYKAFTTPLTLATDNINQTVTMISDPQQT